MKNSSIWVSSTWKNCNFECQRATFEMMHFTAACAFHYCFLLRSKERFSFINNFVIFISVENNMKWIYEATLCVPARPLNYVWKLWSAYLFFSSSRCLPCLCVKLSVVRTTVQIWVEERNCHTTLVLNCKDFYCCARCIFKCCLWQAMPPWKKERIKICEP